jgi:hypothetical protein
MEELVALVSQRCGGQISSCLANPGHPGPTWNESFTMGCSLTPHHPLGGASGPPGCSRGYMRLR